MKKSALLLVLLFASSCAAFAQSTSQKNLAVTLRSERSAYRMTDNIKLEIVRTNVGNQELIVPRWWGWGGGRTNIWVFDSKGKEVVTTFLADELPPPPAPWDFVVLDSGQFLGTRVEEPATHFVNKPGTYEFVVEYTSYLSEDYARATMKMPSFPFWSRERGVIQSNRIRLTITER